MESKKKEGKHLLKKRTFLHDRHSTLKLLNRGDHPEQPPELDTDKNLTDLDIDIEISSKKELFAAIEKKGTWSRQYQ